MKDPVIIIVFATTHDALKAERVIAAAAIGARMVPVPRSLSSDCTMGMEISEACRKSAAHLLSEARIEARFAPR